MFLQNKYTQYYYNIVEAARATNTVGYTEKHHIVPRCLGGSNDASNIVRLTARQHYICHLLLTKMLSKSPNQKKLLHAYSAFLMRKSPTNQREKITSKQYEMLRKARAESAKGHKPHLGHKRTLESRKNQANTIIEKYKTQVHVNAGKSYEDQFGKEEAEQRKAKLRGPRGPRKTKQPLVTCLRCRKTGILCGMTRYHLANECDTQTT